MVGPTNSLFLGCDWGTTNVRLRLIRRDSHAVVAETQSRLGAGSIASAHSAGVEREKAYASELLRLVSELKHVSERNQQSAEISLSSLPVVVSGMAGSGIGWRELPYAELPFMLDGSSVRHCRLEARPENEIGPIYLCSGVCSAEDVIRGEETELIGLLSAPEGPGSNWEGTVILPGTHSKHLAVRSGRLENFRTYMTGEVFAALAEASVLKHSLDNGADFNKSAFGEGVRRAKNEHCLSLMFRVRSRQVLQGRTGAEGSAFLSGLLIGAELWDCLSGLQPEEQVLVAASGEAAERYALAAAEVDAKRFNLIRPDVPLAVYGQNILLAAIESGQGKNE